MRKQPDNCYSLTLERARFSSTLLVRPCACALQDLQLEVVHTVFLAQGLQHTESLYQAEALAGHDRSRWHPFEDVSGTKCNSTVGNQTRSPPDHCRAWVRPRHWQFARRSCRRGLTDGISAGGAGSGQLSAGGCPGPDPGFAIGALGQQSLPVACS